MSKRKHQKPKKQLLFDPDTIATAVHQALTRDFVGAQHVYCLNDRLTLDAFNRQVSVLRKKYVSLNSSQDQLEAATYAKFRAVNDHMGDVEKALENAFDFDVSSRIQTGTPYYEKIHMRARALVHSVLGPFSVSEWFSECKHSGGSTIGVPYRDTSMEKKFTFPMTVTKKAKPYFDAYLQFDGHLNCAVSEWNRENPVTGKYEIVEGSRATTVDKTDTIQRMIAVEASCNMFLQQGVMEMMYKRMKLYHLDVESLPMLHQELARHGSVTGLIATIDWSSASDCSARALLRHLLPPKWFSVCDNIRSEYITIEGEQLKLNMFSTMGNAVTFPLETLVFWAYANAIRLTECGSNTNALFPEWEDLRQVSVFGDDCIVPTQIAPQFIECMESVGFLINDEKSFYGAEQFRESCGGDYLQGFDVRPFCLKSPNSTKRSALEPWLYIICNAFLKKYVKYFGTLSYVYDKELWRCLFGLFEKYRLKIKLVPSFYPDDAGLKLSHDIARFEHQYPMKLSRISVDRHGTCSFNFLRFQYWDSEEKCEGIRLCDWLKKPVKQRREPRHDYNSRERGGYVVAKGLSSHWEVQAVKPVV